MNKFLNADLFMENPENYIRGEKISNIVPNNPYYVEHSIYFAETLSVFEDISKTKRLVLGLDYEFNILDSIASEQSNKDCYRAVLFLKSFPSVYIDYHSYGDFVSADAFNKFLDNVDEVLQSSQEVSAKVDSLSKSVVEHINETTAHAATESVVNNSIALRTAAGTLKASDAQSDNDLTTFAQTKNEISDAKSEMSAKLKEAKDELTHQFNTKIEDLIDNAPDALNTLKELADALTENKDGITAINAALANRYTKQETDEKIKNTVEEVFSGDNDILLKKVNEKFIEHYQKGYFQMPGMPSPLEDENLHFEGYSWYEVNYRGNFFRAKGDNANPFSSKKLTKEQIRNGDYIFQDDEQGDAIRNIVGELGDSDGDSFAAWSNSLIKGGALLSDRHFKSWPTGQGYSLIYYKNIKFNASKADGVKVAEENRSRNLTFTFWLLVKNE